MYIVFCFFQQNSIPNYETPFFSKDCQDSSRSNEAAPYSVPQDAISKNPAKVKSNDYEPLLDSADYASALHVYVNTMNETVVSEDVRGLDYSEISDVDIVSTNNEEDVYSDPGHSEAAVYACFEKKRFRKIKIDDVRYQHVAIYVILNIFIILHIYSFLCIHN